MDYKKDFDHKDIECIANKYLQGEFISPKGKTNKMWYDYKKAVKKAINDCKAYLKMASEHSKDNDAMSDIAKECEEKLKEAENELEWIRSIPTFDIVSFCKYWSMRTDKHNGHLETRMEWLIADRIANNESSESDKQFIREVFEESDYLSIILHFRQLTTPIKLRRWSTMWNNPTSYHPTETPMDATMLYDHREHYIYIESKNVARYGESYWISVDCNNALHSLPVIKAFKEFDFEIGKFYKVQCTDEVHFGKNKKKYIMSIEESSEEEFLEKGIIQFAKRS